MYFTFNILLMSHLMFHKTMQHRGYFHTHFSIEEAELKKR